MKRSRPSTPLGVKEGPRILIAAGLEPSGRAGLLADLETVRALGGTPLAIATALTAQGTKTFRAEPASPRLVAAQVRALKELGEIHAVKLGMIPTQSVLNALRRELASLEIPWVIDPVMISSKGERLSQIRSSGYRALAAPNVVITPNAIEAAWLTTQRSGTPRMDPVHRDSARLSGEALIRLGFGGAIVKGGHLDGDPVDFVCTRDGVTELFADLSVRKTSQRGTGCRFASALAVELARHRTLVEAARIARREVENFLRKPILGR